MPPRKKKSSTRQRGWIGTRALVCGKHIGSYICLLPVGFPHTLHISLAVDDKNDIYELLLDEDDPNTAWMQPVLDLRSEKGQKERPDP